MFNIKKLSKTLSTITLLLFILTTKAFAVNLSGPRVTNANNSSPPNISSEHVDDSEKQEIMDKYRKQLLDKIEGNPGVSITNYECDAFAIILLAGAIVASFIQSAIPTPITLAAIATLTLASANDVACWWSVVRDPVEVFPDVINENNQQAQHSGRYKKITKAQANSTIIYGPTDNYNEAMRTTLSEYLTVCQRLPMPTNFVSPDDLTPEEEFLKEPDVVKWLLRRSGDLKCTKGKAGDTVTINTTKFSIYQRGDRICAKVISALGVPFSWPQNNVGCHKTPVSGVAPMCAESIPITDKNNVIVSYNNDPCYSCFIAKSCYDKRFQIGYSPLPIASSLVQCFLETLSIIIKGSDSISSGRCSEGGLLYNVQKKLFQALQSLITLSLVFYGIKIMLGQEAPKRAEVLGMIIKIALVLYFSAPEAGGMKQYYQYLQDITAGLGDLLVSSAGNTTICDYNSNDYIVNINTDTVIPLPQVALWDRLDCRGFFYLGAPVTTIDTATKEAIEKGEQQYGSSQKFLFIVSLIPALLVGQILVFASALAIMVVVIAMIIWALQIYLLSALALAVVVVVSPLFIPMVMFQYTKPFFDNWLKELIAYTLYPALLLGYLGFFFTVIDDIYFGDLNFGRITTKANVDGIEKEKIHYYLLDDQALGDYLAADESDTTQPLVLGVLGGFNIDTSLLLGLIPFSMLAQVPVKILYPMLKMALALILFMFFNKIIVTIVGELSGGSRSAIELGGSAQDPLETVKKIASATQKGAAKGKELASKGMNALKNKAGGGSKGGGGGSKGGATSIGKTKR